MSMLRTITPAVGRGLVAGLVGTAAMTVSSTLEMRLRGRPASTAPADAVARVLGIVPADERARQRLATVVHWCYGTGWGAVRGLLDAAGVRGPRATAAHLGVVWGTELVTLPALGVTTPAWEWGTTAIAIDALHHAVYAVATGATYELLAR
jgi:hypothetical protein